MSVRPERRRARARLIQSIVTGCDRQISLLESLAFSAMNGTAGSAETHGRVLEVQQRMGKVVAAAVRQVERFADHPPR